MKTPQPKDYRAIEAMNWSSLKLMATSPKLYRWSVDHPTPDKGAFMLGRAVHTAILEPDAFTERYAVKPADIDGRTKAGKEWKLWYGAKEGQEELSEAAFSTVMMCADSVRSHPAALEVLDDTRREETITWFDFATEVACKGRVDAIGPDRLVELKSTRSLERFERDVAEFKYHGQNAFYFDGAVRANVLPADAAVYDLVVETKPPFDVGVFRVPDEVLDAGRQLYRRLLGLWVECERTDTWPGQCPTIRELELPPWADRDAFDEEGW